MLSNTNTDNGSSHPLASEEPGAQASAERGGSAAEQPIGKAEMEERLKKMLNEYEERFDDVDEKLKQLFQKTNFENQKYFKYMNDRIAVLEAQAKEKFQKLQEFLTLSSRHESPSVVKALELELLPTIKKLIENDATVLIKAKTNDFVKQNTFKERVDTFENKFYEIHDRNVETLSIHGNRLETLQATLEAQGERTQEQKSDIMQAMRLMEKGLVKSQSTEVAQLVRKDWMDEYRLRTQERLEAINDLLKSEYDKNTVVDSKLADLATMVEKTYVSRDTWNKWLEIQRKQQEADTATSTKHSEQIEANEEAIENLYELTKAKALRSELGKLREDLVRYCMYEDLKELYAKVLPAIDDFQSQINEFRVDHERNKQIISKFDENIALKANKGDFFELRETKLEKDALSEMEGDLKNRIKQNSEQIGTLKTFMHNLQESMQEQIYDGVKKANATIIKAQEKLAARQKEKEIEEQLENERKINQSNLSPEQSKSNKRGVGLSANRYKPVKVARAAIHDEQLKYKADLKDLVALNQMKSNKFDTDLLMKCVDIQHKQIMHITVLLVEAMKTLVTQHKESSMSKQNKRMYILQQGMSVLHWVSNFEPQSVNADDLVLPNELKKMSNYTKKLLNELTKSGGSKGKQANFYEDAQSSRNLDSNNISKYHLTAYLRRDSLSGSIQSPSQENIIKSPFGDSRGFFNQTVDSDSPIKIHASVRKYAATTLTEESGINTEVQTGEESVNNNQRINVLTHVDKAGEESDRRQKDTTFSGRIGSVTHLGDDDHHYETQQHESNRGKYFRNTRGTLPGTSSEENKLIENYKKVKIAGSHQTTRNFNIDSTRTSRSKDKAWNYVALPSISERAKN